MLWLQLKPDTSKGIHNKPRQKEKLDMQETQMTKKCMLHPHARACTPFSQSLRGTTPTARHTGQLTSTNPLARSRSPSLSGVHPATRSALTKHAGWNVCSQPDAPSTPSERMITRERSVVGSGSSSDGPTPQDTSSQRRPCSRSLCSTLWRKVRPGGGGGTHVRFGAPGRDGACGVAAVAGGGKPPNGADQNHVPSGIRTIWGSSNWNRPGKRGMPLVFRWPS